MQRFASIWLPAFPIERMRRAAASAMPAEGPDAAPFALVEATAHGQRLAALDTTALRAGLTPGLALADARALLPHLLTRPAEPAHDRRAMRRLARWAGRYGPARNVEGADGLWIDITGVAHLFAARPVTAAAPAPNVWSSGWSGAAETALLADLIVRLRALGLTARVAIADTPGAAHALARFGRTGPHGGLIAPPGSTRRALAGLPVEALRLDTDAVVLLKRLGLKRIGTLYDLPRPALARRFQDDAARRRQAAARSRLRGDALAGAVLAALDAALGHAAEPRLGLRETPPLEARLMPAEPLVNAEGIEAAVVGLVGDLAARLATAGLGARQLRLTLYRSDGTLARIDAGLGAASRDAGHLAWLLLPRLGHVDAGFGVDGLVLAAGRVVPLDARQTSLAGTSSPPGRPGSRSDPSAGTGETDTDATGTTALIDRLASRLGAGQVMRLVPRDSHIPERAGQRVGARDAGDLVDARALAAGAFPRGLDTQRPPLLLEPPEPIGVLAGLPEGPPARFTWRRRTCRILKAEGPERIAPEWWHIAARPGRVRDYYLVEDAHGARYWLYREGRYGESEAGADAPPAWYLHGLAA